jgi:16S rRNA (adenine1518-N6/adenine1519-N6)-dimethyltransferase
MNSEQDLDNNTIEDVTIDFNAKNFSAKKSLGQNFLHAPNVIAAMVHAGGVTADSTVLEVGPGKGALTSKLLEAGAKVITIEKDDRAIPFLQEKFSTEIKLNQLEIIHGDVLEFDENNLEVLKGKNGEGYVLIANIPYYITGEFMRKFMESNNPPKKMVVMVQKEVAKRIVDEKESILSISVKVYGTAKYVTSVSRKLFRPIPNVDSAVILIENISKKFFTDAKIDEKVFFEILKAGFAHKRKVVIRNLEDKIPKNTLENTWERNNWPKDIRAEKVNVEMWKKIVGDSCIS